MQFQSVSNAKLLNLEPYPITCKANEIETEHNLLGRMVQVTPDFRRAERSVIVS